jgi:hypothetical protein
MSLINEIRNTLYYDFSKLLNILDFDDLGEYVNIYDKSECLLLMWMVHTKYEQSKIIEYVNKYYKLFDYDKLYHCKNSLIMKLSTWTHSSYELFYILKKINFIKEIMKTNYYNYNLFNYLCWKHNLNNTINFTGILNRPFNKTLNDDNSLIIVLAYSSVPDGLYKNSQIIINYFGILNTPSFIITKFHIYIKKISKTNVVNKLILVYGRY